VIREAGSAWQLRRSEFNHRWLKNEYMPALARLLNVLEGHIEDSEFQQTFVEDVLPRWKTHYPEVLSLIHDCENDMSPRRLFEHPPLSRWPREHRWLPEIVHVLWLSKYQVADKVSDSLAAANQANELYVNLREALECDPRGESVSRLEALRDRFADFRDKCQELAKSIERFPNKIFVI